MNFRNCFNFVVGMMNKILSVFVALCFLAVASAHTTEICAVVDGSDVTLYAGSYHSGSSPVGGVLLNGVRYDFTSVVSPGSFTRPSGNACTRCVNRSHARWQAVTVSGLSDGTYTVTTTCDTAIECPWRSNCFPDITIEGVQPANPCDPDTTNPSVSCPASPVTVEVDRECRAALPRLHALGCDACSDVTLTQAPSSGTVVGAGSYTVTMTGADASGNQDSCHVVVNAVDNMGPVVSSCTASPSVLWPPNNKMRSVTVSVSAEDNCGGNVVCSIRDVWSNDDDAGDTQHNPDIVVTGPLSVDLRAQRDPNDTPDGRVYTVVVDCVDSVGNVSTHTVEVSVPHNRS